MKSKKVVLYYGEKVGSSDPFKHWEKKRSVYHDLFIRGIERGFEMYFVPKVEYYSGGLTFKNPWKYSVTTHLFHPTQEVITADAIYDRSGKFYFSDKETRSKVLNCANFKALCADKNHTYDLLKDFMPQSVTIKNQDALRASLQNFEAESLLALKPAQGFGGQGIIIAHPDTLKNATLLSNTDYVLQQFIDTSEGIPGITKSHHDLRIIIVNGNIVLAHVRTPREGSFIANVAQGGSISEVALDALPSSILSTVQKIQKIIDKEFNYPLYSIDLGVTKEKVYVFELNAQIGFPQNNMRNSKKFIDGILDSLSQRALL